MDTNCLISFAGFLNILEAKDLHWSYSERVLLAWNFQRWLLCLYWCTKAIYLHLIFFLIYVNHSSPDPERKMNLIFIFTLLYGFMKALKIFIKPSESPQSEKMNECDVVRDLLPFANLKQVKYTHRRVLLLVKLRNCAENLI